MRWLWCAVKFPLFLATVSEERKAREVQSVWWRAVVAVCVLFPNYWGKTSIWLIYVRTPSFSIQCYLLTQLLVVYLTTLDRDSSISPLPFRFSLLFALGYPRSITFLSIFMWISGTQSDQFRQLVGSCNLLEFSVLHESLSILGVWTYWWVTI
jgi:hypothetical protein